MFIVLTSLLSTPLLLRCEAILVIEGFDFAEDHPHAPGHRGSRITLAAGQWSEVVHCRETVEEVCAKEALS